MPFSYLRSVRVAVAGSTGLTGFELVNQLAEMENCEGVVAFGRRGDLWHHYKVRDQKVDYNDESALVAALAKIDAVFCCLGTTMKNAGSKEAFRNVDYDFVVHLMIAAEKAGVQQFHLISSMGASTKSSFFYNRVKGGVEEELKKMVIPVRYIYQPGLLGGKRKEHRLGEKMASLIMDVINPLLIGPLFPYRKVPVQKLASSMIANAIDPVEGVHTISSVEILRVP